MNSTILNPDWNLVEEFDDEEDYESEEVEYLTLDFGESMDLSKLKHAGDVQIMGLNSSTPFAQIGALSYQGIHEELIGSEIICLQDELEYTPFAITADRVLFKSIVLMTHDEADIQEAKERKSVAKKVGKGTGKPRNSVAKAPSKKTVGKGKGKAIEQVEAEEEEEVDAEGMEVDEGMGVEERTQQADETMAAIENSSGMEAGD